MQAVGFGAFGEVFAVHDLGVGVGFEEVGVAVGGDAKVHAGVAAELEGAVGAFGEFGEVGGEAAGEGGGGAGGEADFLLVFVVPLDFAGGDVGGAGAEFVEEDFPCGEGLQAAVSDDADVEFAAGDVVFD